MSTPNDPPTSFAEFEENIEFNDAKFSADVEAANSPSAKEIARLRAALERIADQQPGDLSPPWAIARKALKGDK